MQPYHGGGDQQHVPPSPSDEEGGQDHGQTQRQHVGPDHHVAVEDVGHDDEEKGRPPAGMRHLVAKQDEEERGRQEEGEDHGRHPDPGRRIGEEGERDQDDVETPPQVRTQVPDHGLGRPGEARVEQAPAHVLGGVPDVVEGVHGGDARRQGQVGCQDHRPDDDEGERRRPSAHEAGVSPSQRSHH
ncbi:MAG: hypothetical protein P8170_04995 [Gemmatimonadota bacterium]